MRTLKSNKIKKEFLALDVDGDGDVSIKELEVLLRSVKRRLGMSEKDIKNALSDFDQDGDGTVDIEEFLNTIKKSNHREVFHQALIKRAGIRKVFQKYDTDGNGFITRDEFRRVVEDKFHTKLNEIQINELMLAADKNNRDGKIDYDEFMQAFTYFPVTK